MPDGTVAIINYDDAAFNKAEKLVKGAISCSNDAFQEMLTQLWEFSAQLYSDNDDFWATACDKFDAVDGLTWHTSDNELRGSNPYSVVVKYFFGESVQEADAKGVTSWKLKMDTNHYRYTDLLRWLSNKGGHLSPSDMIDEDRNANPPTTRTKIRDKNIAEAEAHYANNVLASISKPDAYENDVDGYSIVVVRENDAGELELMNTLKFGDTDAKHKNAVKALVAKLHVPKSSTSENSSPSSAANLTKLREKGRASIAA